MDETDSVAAAAGRLSAFVGDWLVDGVMFGDGGRRQISGHWTFDEAADGWGVAGTLTTIIEGIGRLAERELIGYDSETGQIHLFSMNRVAIRDHIGGWEGDTLVTRFVSDDKTTVEEIRLRFPTPDRMEASVSEHSNGQLVLTTELSLQMEDATLA